MKLWQPKYAHMAVRAAVVALTLTMGLSAAGWQARAEEAILIDRIVAEVNDDIITLYDWNREAEPFIRRIRSMGRSLDEERRLIYEAREQILNQLVDQRLTDQEVKRYSITVSEAAIDNTIEDIKKRALLSDEELRKSLQAEGLTMEAYRARIRDQILRTRLVNLEVNSKIVITDEDIRAVYEKDRAKYGGEERYHLRHILLGSRAKGNAAEMARTRQQMEEIHRQLTAGASFVALAKAHSESPVAQDGGDLGMFRLADMAPQIRTAVQGLPAGGFTGILDTDQGWQIFYVEEMKAIAGKTFEEAKAEIEGQLYDEIVNRKFASWLAELRARSHVKIVR
jgi:peptidyl-prolyl cis-trans isomerase SurA